MGVIGGVVITALVVLGCSRVASVVSSEPWSCSEGYSERRCWAMADVALSGTGKTRDDVAAVLIVPSPSPSDEHIVQTLGGAAAITVRVELVDGSTRDAQMCGGLPDGPACFDEAPEWERHVSFTGRGYGDIACPGEPPEGCPSPIPEIDAAAAEAATPITVPALDIPIDRTGRFEVWVGEGTLPNGVLSEASFYLPDPWPDDATFAEFSTSMLIRSLEPDGRPFDNKYEHGWREGLERIEAFVVFDVRRFEEGAILRVEDIVVR